MSENIKDRLKKIYPESWKEILVFLDERLKTEEEKEYLSRVEEDESKEFL